jgi:hypothetical protein
MVFNRYECIVHCNVVFVKSVLSLVVDLVVANGLFNHLKRRKVDNICLFWG